MRNGSTRAHARKGSQLPTGLTASLVQREFCLSWDAIWRTLCPATWTFGSSSLSFSSNQQWETDPALLRQCELQFGNPDPGTLEKAGQGDLRRVVAFPLPEAGSRATRAAAHAPGAPQAPVPVHVLWDGRLVHTLPSAAPLKHSRAANLFTH